MLRPSRVLRIAFWVIGLLAVAGVLLQAVILLWSHHELSQVESMIVLEAQGLWQGRGLYHDFDHYPYVVTPYGPLFYVLTVALHAVSIPWLQSERLISLASLCGTFWIAWRILANLASDRRAHLMGLLLLSTSGNLIYWGTIGQTDMLAVCFSLAAFLCFLQWRQRLMARGLIAAGIFVVLAVFTKQTAVSAGCAIAVCLLAEDRKRAMAWINGVVAAGLAIALALNGITHGNFFSNAFAANMNPFAIWKLSKQLTAFLLFTFGLPLVVAVGFPALRRQPIGRYLPLYVYMAFAAMVWLATSAKIGSESNYQLEAQILLVLWVACVLDCLRFFDKLDCGDTGWVTLLQIPLLLYIAMNLIFTFKIVADRATRERRWRQETAVLTQVLASRPGRLLTWNYDIAAQLGRPLEVDVWFYTLLANARRIDPAPLLTDLEEGRFRTVILGMNVFDRSGSRWRNGETLFLPETHLDQIRRHYHLVAHVPGPYLGGDYVYEPNR